MKQNITVEAPTASGTATTVSITVSAQNAAGTGPASAAVQGKTTTVPPTSSPTKQPTQAPPPTPKPTAKSTGAAKTYRIDMDMTMEGVTVEQVKTLKTAIERSTAKLVGVAVSKCKLDESSIKVKARRRLAGGVTFKVNIEATEAEVSSVETKVDGIKSDP